MTTKQRSKLRSLAQNIEPVGQVGKGGLSQNMISGLSDALEKRELVKIMPRTIFLISPRNSPKNSARKSCALSGIKSCFTG